MDGIEKVQEENLEPLFFEQMEVPLTRLSEDWRMVLEVYDKALLNMNDTLIGKTQIDLEQRRWSNPFALAKLTIIQEEDRVKEQMEEQKKQQVYARGKEEKELSIQTLKYLRNKHEKIQEIKDKLKKSEFLINKVEYRPLKLSENNQTPQGSIELFVDVIDHEEQRTTPFQKLKEIKNEEEYEVRLIVWETREVPPPNGSVMSAQIRVTYERTGLNEESDIKTTDVHAGCKTGRAIFNWRMLFRIGNESFPRLKLAVVDTGLAGDSTIGETSLNLSTSIKLLKKIGNLEDKKIWVEFMNPATERSAGFCLIQLQIKHLSEAENDPVGEG